MGCYIMPFFLVAIGGAVLYRMQSERMSLRVTLGLSLILVALLGIIALFTPTTGTGPAALFDRIALVTHGGYVGAALAWVGLTLFGPAISAILLIGVAIVGVIVIGFSISAFLEKVRARCDLDGEGAASLIPDAFGSMRRGRGKPPLTTMAESADLPPAAHGAPTARISLGEQPRRRSRGAAADAVPDAAVTRQLGAQRRRPRAHPGPDPREVAEVEDISAVEPAAPMTRKLGRRRQAAEAAEREAAKTKPVSKKTAPKKKKEAPAQPVSKDGFQLPPMNLLATGGARRGSTEEELREVAAELQGTLEDFGVMASVVGWVEGPTVTLFKDLPSGVRVSKVTNLTDDIALALCRPACASSPHPGTNYVGIEVPNRNRQMVYLPTCSPLRARPAGGHRRDVEGHAIVHDLAKMPHVLIAGTTGSGKSVEVNSMIMSILMRATPAEVRFIMVDPKRVEFAPYEGIPHLYVPVVTECREASSALSWAVAEMERRLKMFSKCGVRNIITFNEKARAAQAADEAAEKRGEEPPENPYGEPIPYIVIVIDELADLMMNVGKEVEFSISRIAQLARAAGIHLIIATQRPPPTW
ncbi:MAG: DNA translocase FtsK [Adlercreutzia equolifaciens]